MAIALRTLPYSRLTVKEMLKVHIVPRGAFASVNHLFHVRIVRVGVQVNKRHVFLSNLFAAHMDGLIQYDVPYRLLGSSR